MSFQGNETAIVDGNGRVSFPLHFRKLVPNEREFYISPGVDNCLHLRRVVDYEDWRKKLDQLEQTPENYARRRKLLHNTEKIFVDDKQNRFYLPKKLKEWADIDKEVVFSGNGDLIVISNVEKAQAFTLSKGDDFKGMEWIL
ncbi:MAG: hypothetical protein LBU89_03955 [Fibromonadaceae bacterium]|jgi:MraZ protein|nr:hypothetical protein [Fibromonadaceae bacterium]